MAALEGRRYWLGKFGWGISMSPRTNLMAEITLKFGPTLNGKVPIKLMGTVEATSKICTNALDMLSTRTEVQR
jgi:hypothetical protein